MSIVLKKITAAAALGVSLLGAGSAHAALLLGQEPDPSLIVRVGNYEWVYASPCGAQPIFTCSAVQLHHGFGFATTEQWNASFTSLAVLDAAFTTTNDEPLCAASYFSVEYDECQIYDMRYGYVWGAPFGNGFGDYSAETFLVRVVDASEVPEPATVGLMTLGVAGFAASRRQRK